MDKTRAALVGFATALSLTALILALVGGSLLIATDGLVRAFTHVRTTAILDYPLGRGVFILYACGIALGAAGWRYPVAAGIAMLPLGAVAFLFGGPVAQVYGILIILIGALFVGVGLRRDKA